MWRGRTVARTIVALCVLGLAVLALVPSANPLAHLEYWTADWRTAYLSDRAAGEHPNIAAVLIDDETLEPYPYLSPTDRGLIREIVAALKLAGAKVIGLDFFFVKPTEPEKDDKLIAELQPNSTAPQIVVGFADERVALNNRQREFQNEYLAKIGRPLGYLNVNVSADGVVRYKPRPARDARVPDSFAQAIAQLADAPTSNGTERIAWLLPAQGSTPFPVVRGQDLVAAGRAPEAPESKALLAKLHNRLVLVGSNVAFSDQRTTPLSVLGEKMPGVLVQAQMLAELVDGRRVSELTRLEAQLLAAGMFLIGCLSSWLATRRGFTFSGWTLGVIFLVAVDAIIFGRWRLVLPFSLGMAAWILGVTAGQFITQMKLGKAQSVH
jgi:CHASE2 domain-containing sensor protein